VTDPQPSKRRRYLRAGLLGVPALALGLVALSPALAAASTRPSAAGARSGSAAPPPGKLNKQKKGRGKTESVSPSGPVTAIDTHLSSSRLAEGKTLFDVNCSSCHGLDAQGSSRAPNLQGLGPGIPYLWVSSGWMPLTNPESQPIRKPNLFTAQQTVDIAEYVGSLTPGAGQPIYAVDLSHASVADGLSLFALNCAPCHTITGAGDAISDGNFAPSLRDPSITPPLIAEAVRQGPGNMPVFSKFVVSNAQLADIAAYVTKDIQHPNDSGGVGLGGIGPVAEGFIALFLGVGGCLVCALWIGERAEDAEGGGPGRGEPEHGAGGDGAHGADAGVIHG
jgi:ubiquinol-cytochrome c reductase cytochrome c subunit